MKQCASGERRALEWERKRAVSPLPVSRRAEPARAQPAAAERARALPTGPDAARAMPVSLAWKMLIRDDTRLALDLR